MSLTNSGKLLVLNDSSKNLIDSVAYAPTAGFNKSLSLAETAWRESLYAGGSPCEQNFLEHNILLTLEQTDANELTAHLINNGLKDENITLNLFIDENFSEASETFIASFYSVNVTFAFNNLTAGEHSALVNATVDTSSVAAELNFSNLLPNADVQMSIDINQEADEYWISANPENSSLNAEVFIIPRGLNNSFIAGTSACFGEPDVSCDTAWDFSSMVADFVDFGSYELCANILEIRNYNDTNTENNFICENFTINPPAGQSRLRIKTFTENEMYNLNSTVFWSAQIFPSSPGTIGNLTVSFQKRNSQTSTELFGLENLNLTKEIILSGNFTIPDDAIEGMYKIRGKFTETTKNYLDSRDSGQFWLNGLKDIGQANITLVKVPSALQFGSFGALFVKFYAGNYNYDKLRFLAYGYPSQVLADTDQSGLAASDVNNASMALELENVGRGQEIYIALPAFTQQNCGSDYQDKTYRIRVRAYQPSQDGWTALTTSDLNVPISGKGLFCSTETKTSGITKATASVKLPKEKSAFLEISSVPDSVSRSESFTTEVKITNNMNSAEAFEVYSYVFEGSKLLTEDGWTGNAKTLKLEPKESKIIQLDNSVNEDAELGSHSLRVRAKAGKSQWDADQKIEIIAGQEHEAGISSEAKGSINNIPITAAAVWRTKSKDNVSIVPLILIAILIMFVFALLRSK